MPRLTWNDDKNLWLQEHRGISFEDVVAHIEAGNVVTVLEHPNPVYPGQQIAVVVIDDYAWAVPIDATGMKRCSSRRCRAAPSRAAGAGVTTMHSPNDIGNSPNDIGTSPNDIEVFDAEEAALIAAVENNEWTAVAAPQAAIDALRAAAVATGRKDKRVNIRLDSRTLTRLRAIALREGLPYQTLISSVLHKYATGQFVGRSDDRKVG